MVPPLLRRAPVVGDALAFRADRLGFLTELATTQGDVAMFRFGPYRVWQVAHPDLIHEVLVSGGHRYRKGPVLQRARLVLGDGLLTAEGDGHRASRRAVQPGFHPDRLQGYATTIAEVVDDTIGSWRPGRPIDVHREAVRLTLTTAGRALLGTEVSDDVQRIEGAIADLLAAYTLGFLPFGRHLQGLPIGPARRLRRGRAVLYDLVDRMVAEVRASDTDRGDLLSALVRTDADATHRSDTWIREQAVTLLLAGHETTATALSVALWQVAGDAALDDRLHLEVDRALTDGGLPAAAPDGLPRCRAVIAETLRCVPPSWAMTRQATEDHRLGGRRIATGDVVICPPWVVHRDARWWADPLRFDPDRWLDGSAGSRPRWAYFPFGAGVRRCLGESFAWTEAVLALAMIVARWRLVRVAPSSLELDPLITLRPRGALWLEPRSRTADRIGR